MGSDFSHFNAGCHGPVPLRGLFRGPTSRKRRRTIDQNLGRESTGFSGQVMSHSTRTEFRVPAEPGEAHGCCIKLRFVTLCSAT